MEQSNIQKRRSASLYDSSVYRHLPAPQPLVDDKEQEQLRTPNQSQLKRQFNLEYQYQNNSLPQIFQQKDNVYSRKLNLRLRTIKFSIGNRQIPNIIPLLQTKQISRKNQNHLAFDSKFECGNLQRAVRVNDYQYDLWMQNDVNTTGNTQWFYFSVQNWVQNQLYQFRIKNFTKSFSLFQQGMKLSLFYSKRQQWEFGGEEILYEKSDDVRSKGEKFYYQLSFQIQFQEKSGILYIAQSIPYTYTQLQNFIYQMRQNVPSTLKLKIKKFAQSLSNIQVNYLKIQSKQKQMNKRKVVVISARVHPGETVSSWVMQGAIKFLMSQDSIVDHLLKYYSFILIPMLNPDGVIIGNYRTSLVGVDLNRRWRNPSKLFHPIIYSAKQLIMEISQKRKIDILIDLHGHSKRQNCFMYGCNSSEGPEATRLFPYLMSQLCDYFNYNYCSFRMQKSKESTFRINLFKELRTHCVYTLETSFYGANIGSLQGQQFTAQNLMDIGKYLCQSIAVYNDQINNLNDTNLITIDKQKIIEDILNRVNDFSSDIDSGSDSNPSEDNFVETVPEQKSFSSVSRYANIKSRFRDIKQPSISRKKEVVQQYQQLKHQQQIQLPTNLHSIQQQTERVYTNKFGKLVKDQSTQTRLITKLPTKNRLRVASQSPQLRNQSRDKIEFCKFQLATFQKFNRKNSNDFNSTLYKNLPSLSRKMMISRKGLCMLDIKP